MPRVRGSGAAAAPGNGEHAEPTMSMLCPREREAADLVTQALSDREISSRLLIARPTAESHVAIFSLSSASPPARKWPPVRPCSLNYPDMMTRRRDER
jgi:FixJ family two-component response regulator